MVKPYVCTQCAKRFTRKQSLKRHENTIHTVEKRGEKDSEMSVSESEFDTSEPEASDTEMLSNESEERESGEESSGEEDEEEEMSSDEVEDNITYLEWFKQAKEATQEIWTDKYARYVKSGMTDDDAYDKANSKTMWAVKRFFFNRYKTFLFHTIQLKDDDTHQEILDDIVEKMDKGVDIRKALNRVVVNHKAKFESLLREEDDEEQMESDEASDEED
jgi:uncharacterized Zn-finger protein